MTIKDAAYEVMVEAYTQASDDGEGGTLPVKPRQIMYRARGLDPRKRPARRRSTTTISPRSCWSTSCATTRS